MTIQVSLGNVTDKSFTAAEAIREAAGAPPIPKEVVEQITDGNLGMMTRYHPICCFSRIAYVNEVAVGAIIACIEKNLPASRRAAKAQAKTGQHFVKVHSVAVLPCFRGRGIGKQPCTTDRSASLMVCFPTFAEQQLTENLLREVGTLNLTTLPPDTVELPEALTATRVQTLTSSSDVNWYQMKRTLRLTGRLPLTHVQIASPVSEGEWLSEAEQWTVPKEMKVRANLPQHIEWRFEL